MFGQPSGSLSWLGSAQLRASALTRELELVFDQHLELRNAKVETSLVEVGSVGSTENRGQALRLSVLVPVGTGHKRHVRTWTKGQRPVTGRLFCSVLYTEDGRVFLLDYDQMSSREYAAIRSHECRKVLVRRLARLAQGRE